MPSNLKINMQILLNKAKEWQEEACFQLALIETMQASPVEVLKDLYAKLETNSDDAARFEQRIDGQKGYVVDEGDDDDMANLLQAKKYMREANGCFKAAAKKTCDILRTRNETCR